MALENSKRAALCSAFFATFALAHPALAQDAVREERIRQAEQLLAQEPTYTDTTNVAIRFHNVDPDALRETLRRVRSKAALPYLRVSDRFEQFRANRTLDDTGPSAPVIDSNEEFLGSRDRALAMMAWDLPQAVFNTAELQTYQQSGMQMGIMRIMNRVYYRRRQLLLSILVDPPVSRRAFTAARLRVEGYTSLLNTFTGGWFGDQLPEGSF